MSENLVRGAGDLAGPASVPERTPDRDADLTLADRGARLVMLVCAIVPCAYLLFLTVEMVRNALPAFIYSGTTFITSQIFSFGQLYATTLAHHNGQVAPHGATYGAVVFIVGTVASSLIALLIAVPLSVGGVLALSQLLPSRIEGYLSVFLQILAGIPSVAFGFWAVLFFGPAMAQHVYPWLAHIFGFLPFMQGQVGAGEGLLTTSLVLAVMIVPIVASTTRELVRTVPVLSKEGALALGMTRYETVRVVVMPYIRRGIVAAGILGWARALGETMAVLMISGNLLDRLPINIYGPFSTLAGIIVDLLDSALTDATGMAVHALAALGVVLLVITLVTNLAGRLIIRRAAGRVILPVGAGF